MSATQSGGRSGIIVLGNAYVCVEAASAEESMDRIFGEGGNRRMFPSRAAFYHVIIYTFTGGITVSLNDPAWLKQSGSSFWLKVEICR